MIIPFTLSEYNSSDSVTHLIEMHNVMRMHTHAPLIKKLGLRGKTLRYDAY